MPFSTDLSIPPWAVALPLTWMGSQAYRLIWEKGSSCQRHPWGTTLLFTHSHSKTISRTWLRPCGIYWSDITLHTPNRPDVPLSPSPRWLLGSTVFERGSQDVRRLLTPSILHLVRFYMGRNTNCTWDWGKNRARSVTCGWGRIQTVK